MSFKRTRTPSHSSSDTSSPPLDGHASKVSRSSTSPSHEPEGNHGVVAHPLLCSLPPTCNPPHNTPMSLANTRELELHYAKYHAHVCEQPGCGCVFPDAWLLGLHQTECHDPIAAVRRDRGEKIFACHLQTCPRFFLTPKARRLHLIQAHAYPKQFFFAVTNKGIGGLLKRWGDGASMIRGQWKARDGDPDTQAGADAGEDVDRKADRVDEHSASGVDVGMMAGAATNGMSSDSVVTMLPEPRRTQSMQEIGTKEEEEEEEGLQTDAEAVDRLAQSMSSLSLVPPSIRFGRGGKNGGFVRDGARSQTTSSSPEGRGRPVQRGRGGGGGRGRGGGVEHFRGRGSAYVNGRTREGGGQMDVDRQRDGPGKGGPDQGIGIGRGIIPVRGRMMGGRGRGRRGFIL